MYATVRRYENVSDADEAGREVNESFVPLLSRIPGFVSYNWIDAGGGVMISTGIFQNKAGADESNRKAAEWISRHSTLLPKPVNVTAGEVVAYEAIENVDSPFSWQD
jgi:hypothetical protein